MPANLTFKKVQLKAKHQYTATLGGRADTAFDPHTMRHACGFKLAAAGVDTRALQAYQGHRNIQHTVRYTELSPTRFKDFWRS